jgi:hypothetical protein
MGADHRAIGWVAIRQSLKNLLAENTGSCLTAVSKNQSKIQNPPPDPKNQKSPQVFAT